MRRFDDTPQTPRPQQQRGGKWSRRGRDSRRQRHENLRDNREQERGGKVDLGSRELARLLQDWDGDGDAPVEEEAEE